MQWLDRFIESRASKTNLTVLSPNAADTDEDGLNNKSREDEDLEVGGDTMTKESTPVLPSKKTFVKKKTCKI